MEPSVSDTTQFQVRRISKATGITIGLAIAIFSGFVSAFMWLASLHERVSVNERQMQNTETLHSQKQESLEKRADKIDAHLDKIEIKLDRLAEKK